MSLTSNNANSSQGEISLRDLIFRSRDLVNYIFSKWKFVLALGISGALLGLFYSSLQQPVYTAECTFVLEDQKTSGGLGQYSGIASMVGIDIGGSGGTASIFQGENNMELYRSRLMIQKTLLSYGEFGGKKDLLINRYIAVNGIDEDWDKSSNLKNLDFSIPVDRFTVQHDSILAGIVKNINTNSLLVSKLGKNLSIISVKAKSKDELFAQQFTKRIVENVNTFYIQTRTKKSLEHLSILQHQADSIRRVLNSSISGAAAASDVNPNANQALQILRVPSQRRQVDVQANSAIYAEVVKNLEIAKISLRQETPLIQVVDEPILPLQKEKFGKAKGLVFGGMLMGFVAVVALLLRKIFKSILSEEIK